MSGAPLVWMVVLALASMLACGMAAARAAMRTPRTEDVHCGPIALGVAGGGAAGFLTLAAGLLAGTADRSLRTVPAVLLPLAGVVVLATCAWQYLAWRNQTIVMLDEERFTYTSWLGRRREYRFCDLMEIRRSLDDIVLVFPTGKVRFDATAHMSRRLAQRLEQCIQEKKQGDPA